MITVDILLIDYYLNRLPPRVQRAEIRCELDSWMPTALLGVCLLIGLVAALLTCRYAAPAQPRTSLQAIVPTSGATLDTSRPSILNHVPDVRVPLW
ncbi:hypothetical protein KGA66_21040 [Actinocrinis puniceicyclus]|uniref:Uncharacterized protein n=1 Tax=Actinocrinis puniceicyclus TaxID=977794 RepID=A0A8J7WSX1_9ACTN|nr:hypothetical protein [Actinocrinis puniceicyclus]MBS2965549.1 hypothetical protein [Actinocrinis puniceicyclus]